MENPVTYLTNQIFNHFFLRQTENGAVYSAEKKPLPLVFGDTELMYFQNEKLSHLGDISLSGNILNWQFFCKKNRLSLTADGCNLLYATKDGKQAHDGPYEAMIRVSYSWLFPIQTVLLQANERLALHFVRGTLMRHVLRGAISGNVVDGITLRYGCAKKQPNRFVRIHHLPAEDSVGAKPLTCYRLQLLVDILHRLLDKSEWNVLTERDEATELNVLNITVKIANCKCPLINVPSINVGATLEPKNKKPCTLTVGEYVDLRSNDMLLMALHKYGIRSKMNRKFMELVTRLGHAAVTVDLFEVRHSSPVLIIRNGLGSTKGASFILYNSARLETLLRTFDDEVIKGNFEPLPDYDSINIELLKEEDEWQLVYGYIMTFPNLIERCISQLEKGMCSVHLIVRYISGLVTTFSGYYRRTQILIYKRENLMPVVFARIYLIKAVRQVLNDALALLDIEPVQYM